MCKPENAIRNMDATGYVSVVATEEVLEAMCDEELDTVCDLSYLFVNENGEPLEGSEAVHIDDVMYPDRSVVDRCGVMHDSGDRTDKMLEMWSRVKGDNLNNGMVIFILVVFGVLLVVGIARKIRRRRQRQRRW
jgi:spermidine/putrescine transport system substrate-binding protein